MSLAEWKGTWTGTCELWVDPLGDVVEKSDCRIEVGDVVRYTWSREGKAHEGTLTPTEDGADFTDTFHHADGVMSCCAVPGARALLCVEGSYMETWGWRIAVCHRAPTGELVLQMTNIAPWGEEARAVRMVAKRA